MVGPLQTPSTRLDEVRSSVKMRLFAFLFLIIILLVVVAGAVLAPDMAETFISIGILFAVVTFVFGFLVATRYADSKLYEQWVEFMNKRYGNRWDENRYGFAPFFKHSEDGNRGKEIFHQRGFWVYDNGLLAENAFRGKKERGNMLYTFIPWTDIEAVWLPRSPGGLTTVIIETVDLKTAREPFFDSVGKLAEFLPILQEKMGHRWLNVFKGEVPPYDDQWQIHSFVLANTKRG